MEQWDGIDTTKILKQNDEYLTSYMFENVKKYFKAGIDLNGNGKLEKDEGCI